MLDGRCSKIRECLWAPCSHFFSLVFNRSGILYNVLTWEIIEKCVLFWIILSISNDVRGCEYVIRRAIHQTPLADRNVKKGSLETPFDAVSAPSSVIICLVELGKKRRRRTTNWPNYYQFFTGQYTSTHKIYIFFSLIRLIYCFVIAAICYVIIIYFVNEHDIFSPSPTKVVYALLSFIIRIDFFSTAFTPFRILCVFLDSFYL